MKKFGVILTISMLACLILAAIIGIKSSYRYNNEIGAYWQLADKSSTISEKSKYIDMFVAKLESAGLSGRYNAIILKTPNNSFDANFMALKSLQSRLKEIETMDIKSFEYQTAIQQITTQEQGEASDMLYQIRGAWGLAHYPYLWNWIGIVGSISTIILLISGIYLWTEGEYL